MSASQRPPITPSALWTRILTNKHTTNPPPTDVNSMSILHSTTPSCHPCTECEFKFPFHGVKVSLDVHHLPGSFRQQQVHKYREKPGWVLRNNHAQNRHSIYTLSDFNCCGYSLAIGWQFISVRQRVFVDVGISSGHEDHMRLCTRLSILKRQGVNWYIPIDPFLSHDSFPIPFPNLLQHTVGNYHFDPKWTPTVCSIMSKPS